MTRPTPPCPFCRSSATLPFEEGDADRGADPPGIEIMLVALLFLLFTSAALLVVLLGRASLPAALLLIMAIFLAWRGRDQRRRRRRQRPRRYLCLDCSRGFKAL